MNTLPKVSPDNLGGKRKKPNKLAADVDADQCVGTSEEGIEGSLF